MVGFHPAFSRHVRAEAKHLAKKKKLDSPGKETPTLSYYLCSLWGTLLRYPIEITMRIMMWESLKHSLLVLLSFPQFFYEIFKNIIIAHKL